MAGFLQESYTTGGRRRFNTIGKISQNGGKIERIVVLRIVNRAECGHFIFFTTTIV